MAQQTQRFSRKALTAFLTGYGVLAMQPALATSFTITDGQVIVATQSLQNNETGVIESGGQLNSRVYVGQNATLNNAGIIELSDDFLILYPTSSASAPIGTGSSSHIYNSGVIRNTASAGSTIGTDAIYSNAEGAQLDNSGTISSAEGTAAFLGGNNVVINNNGDITGATDGIYVSGRDVTINNSGLISGTDAIDGYFGMQRLTVNLLPGSKIVGRLNVSGLNATLNIRSASLSQTSMNLNLVNNLDLTVNLIGSSGIVIDDGSSRRIVTVDPTAETSRGVALADLTSSITGVVNQRIQQKTTLQPVQLASLTLSPEMLFQPRKPIFWSQLFGGKRDNDNASKAYERTHSGINLGYEWDSNSRRFGVVGGVANSTTKTKESSFDGTTDTFYGGVYGHFYLDTINLSATVLAGVGDHDNKRIVADNIIGNETAKSNFASSFVSVSGTVSSAFTLTEKFSLKPSATLTYSLSKLDGYSETGTTNTNLTVDSRDVNALNARAQVGLAYQVNNSTEVEARAGLLAIDVDEGSVTATLSNTSFAINNASDESGEGAFFGINARTAWSDTLDFSGDIEFGAFDSDDVYVSGALSAIYRF